MIIFLDENDVEYGALATIKATNAVNGERSITGEITSGDAVLSRIERGWRLRFEDEYYVVTFAKPIDEGKNVQVSFDAVHQFFWDFGKSSVYDQLSDGSHTFRAYLDFIFDGSGYRYDIESSLTVKAFEKQSFGYKNRLSLFNDIITSSGVEFQVNGKVVRILAKVGTDLSTVVRKNFNLNELGIEKNIGNFVTYQKGFGAYFDEEDHSKGRLIAEYTSPLASVYGKLEADPLVDERYKQQASLLSALKENVDNSYTISVSLDMEDLTRAGYRYTQPVAGDYIMAINETLGFKEKIRIVSFTSEYDVAGQLIKHTVTCNDIGSVKKLSASYTQTQHQAANAEINANTAYEFANKALVSANGKNTNYYGDSFPVDNPKGTLKKGDLLFLTVGDTVKQYYWNGAEWVTNPVVSDVEAFKEQIAEDLKDVPNREEFENKIAEELANSKAEIETQIETAKTQAESNAKEYADTINQETAKVAELANTAADEIKADLVNVKNNLTSTSIVANNAQAAVDEAKQDLAEVASDLNTAKQDLANSVAEVNTKVESTKAELTQAKQDLTEVAGDLNTAKQDLANSVAAVNTKVDSAKAELTQTKQQLTTVADDLSQAKTDLQTAVSEVDTKATNVQNDLSKAKQDLTSQAQQLQAQATAQTELTKRVSTVETTANGTKTTVSELSKTVDSNTKNITSVTARTKVVEDDLTSTKTTLSQVKTTADSASKKTATLETGLNGLSAKFDSLKVGSVNLLKNSKTFTGSNITGQSTLLSETYSDCAVRYLKNTNPNSPRQELAQFNNCVYPKLGGEYVASFWAKGSGELSIFFHGGEGYLGEASTVSSWGENTDRGDGYVTLNLTSEWERYWIKYKLKNAPSSATSVGKHLLLRHNNNSTTDELWIAGVQLEEGNIATDYSPNESDIESKVAEYKQNADQNYASLQTTVQNLDGTVQHNKTVADQTAQGFTTRIESLETYKDGESTRANQYFELAKTETARQLSVERTAISKNYVAKSTYTSDVTGIRNELSATTSTANATKTNLANYQASNDKAVANLQSNIQTANGNISNLQTKVEAVPGQITSAVSAVEGKIPTEIGGVNLLRDTKKFNGNNLSGYGKLNGDTYKDCAVRYFKNTDASSSYQDVIQFSNCLYPTLGGTYTASFWAKGNCSLQIFFHGASGFLGVASGSTNQGQTITNRDDGSIYITLSSNWQRYYVIYKLKDSPASAENVYKHLLFRHYGNSTTDEIWLAGVKLEEGGVATAYTASQLDTDAEISTVQSEFKQTTDTIKATVQALDGQVQSNKTVAEQTAEGFKTRIESLETYKSGESERANQYFELAKTETARQLSVERTAIAKDYVAKSTYTSDVTGIRNELSATTITANTTKQNLASYQASNDKVVANLQSNIQTANGDISSLKTKVEAVPGQITSAVSAVESKIPTEIGAVNLLKNSKSFTGSNIGGSGAILSETYQGCAVRRLKVTGEVAIAEFRNCVYPKIGGEYVASFWAKGSGTVSVFFYNGLLVDSFVTSQGISGNTGDGRATFTLSENWQRYWIKYKLKSEPSSATSVGKHLLFRTPPNGSENDVYLSGVQLEQGNVVSGYEPAPEDTAEQISSLSSEIKQTADGITLLATKTELSTAKNELQSGINTATNKANAAQNTANSNAQTLTTHTTQISALNTGLSAKVSQSDFNTLTGRVTTAENNIIAKANELSSKITSVEGKIPTEIGSSNLLRKTTVNADNLKLFGTSNSTISVVTKDGHQTYKIVVTANGSGVNFNGNVEYYNLIKDRNYTFSFWVLTNKDKPYSFNSLGHIQAINPNSDKVGNDELHQHTSPVYSTNVVKANTWTKVWCTFKATSNSYFKPYFWYLNSGDEIYIYDMMLNEGKVPLSYTSAPEDTAEQISSLSSEIKQTADGITLLATKTELNSAKNELQSGINTATNKANNAQATANSNAQTISTHTTQISALNTGLSAKVSQTDFNTLSGRVTTAENNIIAKANELSSKITSVEGNIPSGEMNLVEYGRPADGYSPYAGAEYATHGFYYNSAYKMYIIRNQTAGGKYLSLNRFKVERNTDYTLYFKGFNNSLVANMKVWFLKRVNGSRNDYDSAQVLVEGRKLSTSKAEDVSVTFNAGNYDEGYLRFDNNGTSNSGPSADLYFGDVSVKKGKSNSGWSPSLAELASSKDLKSAQSEIKQTQDGMTLLATKTEVSNAKNELQSGINTATNKANTAQSTADGAVTKANNAQSTANNNAQTISTHTTQISALNTGLQAKVSQTDFNTLSGRVTTAENNITANAGELSSKITSLEGKLPSGEMNLVEYGRPADGYSPYAGAEYATHGFYYNSAYKMYIIRNQTTGGKYLRLNRFKVERNTDYTLYFKGFNNSAITHMKVWFLKRVSGSRNDYDSAQVLVEGRKLSTSRAEDVSVTFNAGNYDEGYIRFDNSGTTTEGPSADLYFGDVSVKKGKSNNGWSPSLAELASSQDLKTAQSEFKQTTDSIKASVQSLDNNTVKSSSLTINTDGVVIKAGKSTSDFANAVGSYFSVNQNAINLFSDKINVKGNMIVSGAITSDKIASKQINTAHLNGKIITADVISSNAVTADAIKAGAVTTDKMSANSINGDRITAGTLDAAKIRAGSITASQIASGTITSAQIKTGTISAANIAAGAITSDKIAANSIDASKIAANAITANMITGGQLRSTNGATVFDLNAGTLTFNNNYGYIQRVANGKIFAITTSLSNTSDPSKEYLTSAFNIRKSDNSRYAGIEFSLYNNIADKPIAESKMNADEFILYDSKNTQIFSVCSKGSWLGNFNMQGWGDIPVANLYNGGLLVKDIGIGGHAKSLLKIVEELCNKTGVWWI